MKHSQQLKFSFGNSKVKNAVIFDLLAGHTCPGAKDCLARVNNTAAGRRIQDGKDQVFRCYAASLEAVFPKVYDAHKHNLNLLKNKTVAEMVSLIYAALPKFAGAVRIHSSGDYFSQDYFDAWLEIARLFPKITFYGYTKSLPFWIARLSQIPSNMTLVASRGGKFDHLIKENGLREASVELINPTDSNLLVDHDDSLASNPNVQKFSLLPHGTQSPGSKGSLAIKKMKMAGVKYSYSDRQ